MKWEYKLHEFPLSEIGYYHALLNSLGAEGWELVTIVSGVGTAGSQHLAVFKRPKPESN